MTPAEAKAEGLTGFLCVTPTTTPDPFGVVASFSGPIAMQPEYTPSPEEIAAACAEIQSTWTDEDRIKRRRGRPKVFECDPEQIRRDALAKLETRLTQHEGTVVVEDTSRRGDAVPWELEPLALG